MIDIANSRTKWPKALRGKQCVIYIEGELLDEAKKKYGRENQDNLCLKIFNTPMEGELKDYYWGSPWREYSPERTEQIGRRSKLYEATVIQNICAMFGFAPRVYALYIIEQEGKKYPVQLVDFLEGDTSKSLENYEEMKKLGEEYGFFPCHTDLIADNDFIGGKLIDFQGFRYKPDFEEKMKDIYRAGIHGKIYYQRIEQLGLNKGPRHTEDRAGYLKLADLDLKGKKILDLGCAGGSFTRSAIDLGASRAIGMDNESSIRSAKYIANYLGYFNNDYIVKDLKSKDWSVEEYDVVFYISVFLQIGIPKQLEKAKMMVIEHNGYEERSQDKLGKPWTDWFSKIKFVGRALDHGNKSIFHCFK